MYRLTLNPFATKFFKTEAIHVGCGMTPLLEKALGKDNYDKYLYAQDPLVGQRRIGEIRMLWGKSSRLIGTIEKLYTAPGLNPEVLKRKARG